MAMRRTDPRRLSAAALRTGGACLVAPRKSGRAKGPAGRAAGPIALLRCARAPSGLPSRGEAVDGRTAGRVPGYGRRRWTVRAGYRAAAETVDAAGVAWGVAVRPGTMLPSAGVATSRRTNAHRRREAAVWDGLRGCMTSFKVGETSAFVPHARSASHPV